MMHNKDRMYIPAKNCNFTVKLRGLPRTATPQNILEMWNDYRVRNGACIIMSSYLPYEIQAEMNIGNLREMTI
jgi:hypothetical protein